MLDFNHGSGPLVKPPGWTPKEVHAGARINELIEVALQARRAATPPREYIGASELGEECLRKLYYSATKAPRKPFDGQKLRIFDMGHEFEDLMARWLKAAGFDLIEKSLKTGKQFEFITGRGRIKGHSDGIIAGGPEVPMLTYPALWENKALKADWWNKLVKSGLQAYSKTYWAQLHLYMGYFEVPICLFTALNKNTGEIWHEVIPYQLKEAQFYSDRGVELIRAVDTHQVPKRMAGAKSADFFKCRWCDFAAHCWSQP